MALGHAVTRFLLAVIGVIALVANACGGAEPATSPVADGGSGASGASPIGSGGPAGSGGPGGGDVTIVAEGLAYTTPDVSAPAGKPFNILFQNRDQSSLHDVDILRPDGSTIFDGMYNIGPKNTTYNVPALPAGSYKFRCSVHPDLMTGTLKAG